MKKIPLLIMTSLLAMTSAQAEVLKEAEIPSTYAKISKDGTGVVKFKECDECDYTLVKITPSTIAYLNGVKTSVAQAKKQSKRGFIGFKYSPSTKEVYSIGFTN